VNVNNVKNFSFHDNTITQGTDYPHWQTAPDNVQIGTGVTTGKIQK
jgi:hypothetical protein